MGYSRGSIWRCYSTGMVYGQLDVGGLVGFATGTIIESYWDRETSGLDTSQGGQGKTTMQMQMGDTFTTWNSCGIVAWSINEGQDYPHLVWENKSGFPIPDAGFPWPSPEGWPPLVWWW